MAVQKAVSLARTKHRAADVADGKGRWTGRPQDPGFSPRDEALQVPHTLPDPEPEPDNKATLQSTSPGSTGCTANCEEDGSEEKSRVAPGQSLKPSNSDVFDRLHAYHAASLEKKALVQKLAAQQAAAQTETLKRCTVRTCSSEEEAVQIYGRLYQEAAHRRRRQVEREQEEALSCLSSQCSTSSLRSQAEGPPRWEQLYHSAPLKEKRLGDERKRAAEAEERWLAQHCIHRSGEDADSVEIFERLYGESETRERRREQRRAAEVASQERALAESSVHNRTLSVADLELRTRRLYEDGLQRLQRLEERRQQECQQAEAPRRSASAGPSRFEMLYSDANRRDEDRKFWQKCHEKEELEMCQRPLGKVPPCKRQVSAQRTPTPVKTPRSARDHQRGPDTDELEMAQEAPLPTHSALVLLDECLPAGRDLPGRHRPQIPAVALNARSDGFVPAHPSSTVTRRAQSPAPTVISIPLIRAGSAKLLSGPSTAASPVSPVRSQTPTHRSQTRVGHSTAGKERTSSAQRSTAASSRGPTRAETTSSTHRSGKGLPLEDAVAKRAQSPLRGPRAVPSQVDGSKAGCGRPGGERPSPPHAQEAVDTRSPSRTPRAAPLSSPSAKAGPARDVTPPPALGRSKTPQASAPPSRGVPAERGANAPRTKTPPPERDKSPKAATPRASPGKATPRAATKPQATRGATPPRVQSERDRARTPPKVQAAPRNDPTPGDAPRAVSRSAAIRTGAWPR